MSIGSDSHFFDTHDTTLTNDDVEVKRNATRKNERYSLREKINKPNRLIESEYSAVILEPNSYKETLNSENSTEWKEAI